MISKKGGVAFAIVMGISLFIFGMVAVNMLTPEVTRTRSATDLNCVNASNISDGTKLTCLAVDFVVPYWFIIIFATAGGLITKRFMK